MNINLEPILLEQKSVFMQMMELYMYDFSEFSDADINEYGYFGYSRIDDYWNEEGRYPFFIRVDEKLAGLVLVRSCCEYNDLPNPHNIAEFFVMKKYRRKGVGNVAAMKVFDMFPGSWEVSQWTNNLSAQNFWKQVISEYTKGKYDTFIAPGNRSVGFTFCNSSDVHQESKIIENMINWARGKLGNTQYAGWCLAFIEDALEISNNIEIFGGDCAKESCEMYYDAIQTGMPERGAFVFYDCLCPSEEGIVNWGHCGISLGGGQVIHAWDTVRIDDFRQIEKLTSVIGEYPEYIGWVPLERVLLQKPDK